MRLKGMYTLHGYEIIFFTSDDTEHTEKIDLRRYVLHPG